MNRRITIEASSAQTFFSLLATKWTWVYQKSKSLGVQILNFGREVNRRLFGLQKEIRPFKSQEIELDGIYISSLIGILTQWMMHIFLGAGNYLVAEGKKMEFSHNLQSEGTYEIKYYFDKPVKSSNTVKGLLIIKFWQSKQDKF